LYNRCDPSEVTELQSKENLPFANCAGFISEQGTVCIAFVRQGIDVCFELASNGVDAYVSVGEDLYGVVGVAINRDTFVSRFVTHLLHE
jgi:hypothetical protein